jgi:hypothetical protein
MAGDVDHLEHGDRAGGRPASMSSCFFGTHAFSTGSRREEQPVACGWLSLMELVPAQSLRWWVKLVLIRDAGAKRYAFSSPGYGVLRHT